MSSYPSGPPLVSEALFNLLTWVFIIPANAILTIMGVLSNLANIIVFVNMTPIDTMSISFTALAVSDLIFSIFSVPYLIINILIEIGIKDLYNVDLRSLIFTIFLFQKPLFHKISITIVTFVSVERSLCVMRPFLIKQIFTRRRVTIILAAIFFSFIIWMMPAMVTVELVWIYPFNRTAPLLVRRTRPEHALAESIVHLSAGFPLVLITQVIIAISAVLMASGLKRHQQFRQAASSASKSADNKERPVLKNDKCKSVEKSPTSNPTDEQPSKTSITESSTPTETASNKEQRLIKTVLVLAIIHVALNFPQLLFYIASFLVPEYRSFKRYNNLYILSSAIINLFNSVNGMVNTLVYITLNTRYRVIFNKFFLGK
ncbi:chemosensory receptor c [Plakobranchus ocellatus]|uniref:Chemosensory receptor c n=1 Tax=Plakobranchus ocellatus TaxID=259542 RepID=A0AAV3Z3M0_9GAST|nr:chemosensory receptor c [Plakobranchus ocellatus]